MSQYPNYGKDRKESVCLKYPTYSKDTIQLN